MNFSTLYFEEHSYDFDAAIRIQPQPKMNICAILKISNRYLIYKVFNHKHF